MPKLNRNPWVAIMNAAANGRGLRLSGVEVYALSRDSAIKACAENDVDSVGDVGKIPLWKDRDPKKYPVNSNLA